MPRVLAVGHGKNPSGATCLNPFTNERVRGARTVRLPVIVLAGDRSRRFGGDKLAAVVDGRPALSRVISRVAPFASEVIVATTTPARRRELARLVPSTVRFLYDHPSRRNGTGPAAAMVGALEAADPGPVLFVPGDIPWVETRALRRLIERASQSGAEVATPCWGSGETEHLIQWHQGNDTLRHLVGTGTEWSSGGRASEFLRAVPRTLFVPVPLLSDRPKSFSHLTYPSDVENPPERGRAGRSKVPRLVAGAPKHWYRLAQTALRSGRYADAARAFSAESRWYARANLPLLAQHASADALQAGHRRAPASGAKARLRGLPRSGGTTEQR